MIESDLRSLLLSGRPMMDLRAPVEFARGAFPTAINLPLMTDDERSAVGTCYKQDGPDAALALGHRLVSGATRDERMTAWKAFCQKNPDGVMYCFRGGQRSAIVQQWLADEGIDYPRIKGGYKALRGLCIEAIERLSRQQPILLLGGRTGTGKTEIVQALDSACDLEGHANHRGSSFGRQATAQPTPIDFENALAIDWMDRARRHPYTVFEDESRLIGTLSLPEPLWSAFERAPVAVVTATMEERVVRIRADFVDDVLAQFETAHYQRPFDAFSEHLLSAVDRIRKRLGGARHKQVRAMMEGALAEQEQSGITEGHNGWIEILLRDYYDPMYDYQLERREVRTLFEGDREELTDYLAKLQATELAAVG